MIMPTLSWILLLPTMGLGLLALVPSHNISWLRRISTFGLLLPLVLSVWFFIAYEHTAGGFQFIEKIPWVVPFGIAYHLGVDGINSLLLVLVGIVSLCAVLISAPVKERVKEYYILLLLTTIGAYGAFLSLDIFFFYFFHEIVTIPVFLMIAIWGSDRKEHAAMKLTLYLTAGAAPISHWIDSPVSCGRLKHL